MISVSMATYPARAGLAPGAIMRLAAADKIRVYLNGYAEAPSWLLELPIQEKLQYQLDPSGHRRAAAKFHWAHTEGYQVICDDDVIYPPDFVDKMIAAVDRYDRKAIIGVIGIVFEQHATHYRKSRKAWHRIRHGLEHDTPVHALGTGQLALHSDAVKQIDWQGFNNYQINCDVFLAAQARKHDIPLVAIARPEFWIRLPDPPPIGIFEEKNADKSLWQPANDLIASLRPWPSPIRFAASRRSAADPSYMVPCGASLAPSLSRRSARSI